MEISQSLEWDSNDIQIWAAFLQSKTGLRLLPKVLESVPGLLGSGDTNAILIRNGEVRGFTLATQALLSLSERPAPPPPPTINPFPPLDDDTQWNDGQTLKPK